MGPATNAVPSRRPDSSAIADADSEHVGLFHRVVVLIPLERGGSNPKYVLPRSCQKQCIRAYFRLFQLNFASSKNRGLREEVDEDSDSEDDEELKRFREVFRVFKSFQAPPPPPTSTSFVAGKTTEKR